MKYILRGLFAIALFVGFGFWLLHYAPAIAARTAPPELLTPARVQTDATNQIASTIADNIKRCWLPPAGRAPAEAIELKLGLSRDGMIQTIRLVKPELLSQSPTQRAYAESLLAVVARAAPLPQSCLGLNRIDWDNDLYHDWETIIVTISP